MSYHCQLHQAVSESSFFEFLELVVLLPVVDPLLGQILKQAQSLDFLASITNWSCFKFKANGNYDIFTSCALLTLEGHLLSWSHPSSLWYFVQSGCCALVFFLQSLILFSCPSVDLSCTCPSL